ncbi:uncharacterized protein N0V89_006010 [Didymosphaeria variabile]|uniref:FAD-binding domain-containing protein n=1 Tax=Didymosphaeria variabile TaxID=1932322 RepID=A0A9W9CB07_9PLEO|nr:uncharacterized protein N0V89_006010 [Didymosphaeria variabile]KAJ4354276.1 hypothetical protein N0V89_006010 [Didymosphaeria variabile]
MERAQATNISILVVGAGIAGLTFAIEAYRKGHDVRLFERRPTAETEGEMILILPHALRTPSQWPGFMERANREALPTRSVYRKHDGTVVLDTHFEANQGHILGIYRGALHNLLYMYSQELGIPIEFSASVSKFDETNGKGSITLVDGRNFTADVVVAADGVGTKSWEVVVGNKETPVSSGFVLYRRSYPEEVGMQDPDIAREFGDTNIGGWMTFGPDAHCVVAHAQGKFSYLLTCSDKDSGNTEDWQKYVPVERALNIVKGWSPGLVKLIEKSPDRQMLEWKLMWRDPQPQSVSPRGRIVQIGDAAHPFLPTSANGASMAMEDGYTLAACLQLGGSGNIPQATKVFNHLRFERVSCAQKQGFKFREVVHKLDPDYVKDHPELLESMSKNWTTTHNAEKYAYDNYASCVEHLQHGTPFKNTNIPPGYTYKPWTVKELLRASELGLPDEDEGQWL